MKIKPKSKPIKKGKYYLGTTPEGRKKTIYTWSGHVTWGGSLNENVT